jgi:hypothetical protein
MTIKKIVAIIDNYSLYKAIQNQSYFIAQKFNRKVRKRFYPDCVYKRKSSQSFVN